MADIFDKKEEVLDFILTKEGRKLLSSGLLKPAYYEFYDSDIIYEANNSEIQNETKERIESGLYAKAIPSIDEINELGGTIKNDNSNLLKNPIGSAQIQNQYAPAWKISFNGEKYIPEAFSTSQRDVIKTNLDNNVISSGSLRDVDTFEERIPQFYVNVNYKLYANQIPLANGGTINELYFDNRNKDLFIAIEEENAFEFSEPREYEVEIYKVVENKNGTDPYTLERLVFDEEDFESLESVEKYFNVLLDEEARFENNFKQKNIYTNVTADSEELCETEQE
tara:strand:- start:2014 stop:2856 length:843 start_codon:yes stop_codon:yes gene_type:complete